MSRFTAAACALAAVLAPTTLAPALAASGQEQKPTIQIPQPGVPQIMTLEGNFVRVAYNNEGYVIIGYKVANLSVGDEWLMLDVGTTLLNRGSSYVLKRDALSVVTPDGSRVPLATYQDYRNVDLRALEARAKVARDTINYFPPMASKACRIGFFPDGSGRAMSWDEVELSDTRACLGRLYFKIPGGITYGQHWLDVKFENSLVRVPFRILTKDEEKTLSKNYKDIRKQVEEAFKPKKAT